MIDWPAQREGGLLRRMFPDSIEAQAHWAGLFDRVSRGEIDTWDYQWAYATFKSGGVSCMPAVNLISNIGFGADATHTHDPEAKLANLPSAALPLPIRHPHDVVADRSADDWTVRNVFGIAGSPVRQGTQDDRRKRRGIRSRVRRMLQTVTHR